MSVGSVPTLIKNAKAVVPGLATYFTSMGPNLGTLKKMKDRQWNLAPQEVKDLKEVWDEGMWKKGLSQKYNMWIDKELHTEVSRKALAELHYFKMDSWKLATVGAPIALTGGYGLAVAPFWLGNDTWQPSTTPQTPEAKAQWREAQDLYRYKYSPAVITATKWWLEMVAHIPEKYVAGWEEIFEKNDVRRCPNKVYSMNKMYEAYQPFHLTRRQQIRMIGRAMGIPTFPTWSKICLLSRVKDFWEIAFNEDYIVLKQNLVPTMSDEELYDYAWRRYLAPYDKKLTREQLVQRVSDYHTVLGPDFLETGHASNIYVVSTYCFGYYNEPGFLEGDIADLDANDFEGMKDFTKDAFMQRLEFENGPLRDQVEAHTIKKNAEIEAKLKAIE